MAAGADRADFCRHQRQPRATAIAQGLAAMPADVYARTKADLRGATIARLRDAVDAEPLLAGWVS